MSDTVELLMIKKFVTKSKQERYSGFISKPTTRNKFTEELYHFKDFNWNLFREIKGSENLQETLFARINSSKSLGACSIISAQSEFDGKSIPSDEAINNIVGTEATILIFGEASVIYYEAEPGDGRYITI
jgi:hypothetical protein